MIGAKNLCLLLACFFVARDSSPQSATDIIEKYLTAIGGKAKLERVSSYSINGTGHFSSV